MRKLFAGGAAAIALLLGLTTIADAATAGGGFRGGGFRAGGGFRGGAFRGGFRGGEFRGFRGGFYGPRFGFGIGFYDPLWWPWYYPWYYPYYLPREVIVQQYAPAAVYSPPEGLAPQQYWYYCNNPAGYYPYIQQCVTGWQTVNATPGAAPPAPPAR